MLEKRPALFRGAPTRNSELVPWLYAAPLVEQTIEWLELEHGINVSEVADVTGCWFYQVASLHPSATYIGDCITSNYGYKRGEALREGILHALTLL